MPVLGKQNYVPQVEQRQMINELNPKIDPVLGQKGNSH